MLRVMREALSLFSASSFPEHWYRELQLIVDKRKATEKKMYKRKRAKEHQENSLCISTMDMSTTKSYKVPAEGKKKKMNGAKVPTNITCLILVQIATSASIFFIFVPPSCGIYALSA